MLERTIRVTHPRNHYTKISHVRAVNGTIDDCALQLAGVRQNRNEVGGAAYHRHQEVCRSRLRVAPPS